MGTSEPRRSGGRSGRRGGAPIFSQGAPSCDAPPPACCDEKNILTRIGASVGGPRATRREADARPRWRRGGVAAWPPSPTENERAQGGARRACPCPWPPPPPMDGARRAARSERTSRAIGRRLAADAVASAMATPARASTQVWQNAEPSEPPEPRPAAALLPMAPSLLGGRMQPLRNGLSSGFVRGNATHTPLRARGLRREKFPRPPLWGSQASVVASEKGRSGGSSAPGGRRSRGADRQRLRVGRAVGSGEACRCRCKCK